MQITHNGKTYKWIGDKWGKDTIKAIGYLDETVVYSRNGLHFHDTLHTLDQLVKLGYLELVEETKPVLLPTYKALKEPILYTDLEETRMQVERLTDAVNKLILLSNK